MIEQDMTRGMIRNHYNLITNNMPFLPENYKEPETSNYMKWVDGKNKFRVLSDAITGWEYWTNDNKPVRSRTEFKSTPNIKPEEKVKYFWAMVVWNYQAERVQILEITQKTIRNALETMNADADWGDPKGYDITVNRSGSGFETEYTVTPKDAPLAKEIKDAYESMSINLEALFDNGDPFSTEKVAHVEKMSPAYDTKNYPDGPKAEDIPF